MNNNILNIKNKTCKKIKIFVSPRKKSMVDMALDKRKKQNIPHYKISIYIIKTPNERVSKFNLIKDE